MVELDRLSDGHIHTKLCHHAVGEMEEYVVAALAKGLRHMVFLEHFEAGVSYFEDTWLTEEDFVFYRQEGQRLQVKYRGQIEIEIGVEVGFNPLCIQEINRFIAKSKWARVGLSYHFMAVEGGHHINMLSRQHANIKRIAEYGPGRMLDDYYTGLLLAVQTINADVVCHLDAGLRHGENVVYTDQHWQLVAEILDVMVGRNLALEINTSGIPLRGEPFPCQRIIEMAVRRDIKMVLGSDAHRPEQVGRCFDVACAV